MRFSTDSKLPAALAAALAISGLVSAQVTDKAVISSYGHGCGITLSATDEILGNGNHWLTFTIQGATPSSPVGLFFGAQETNFPLPFGGCPAFNNLMFNAQGMALLDGSAVFQFQAPAGTKFTIFAQAISLDMQSPAITSSNGLELIFPGQSPTKDPAADSEYPCYYISNLNWDYGGDGVPVVNGKVRWPSSTCDANDGPPAGRPIVIFMHGNGMNHQDHDYLMAYLARNGFVTCSIANGSYLGGSNEGRARQAISYLNAMHAFWGWKHRLSSKVIFMGHSRGGEAAITAARLLHEQPQLASESFDVRAIVSIAPTDGGGDNSDPKEDIIGAWADGFLGIYGSRDEDVRGVRLEDPLLSPENTVFAIYDRAGTESSSEGLLISPPLTKSLIYVEGASHYLFEDSCPISTLPATISCNDHKNVAKGYINAFLQWKVNNESEYRPYFSGEATPTTLRLDGVECFTQFSDSARRVIDNFEQGGTSVNTLGGSVYQSAGIAVAAEGNLWQMDPSSPNDTRGMRIKWNNAGSTPYVRWTIPNGTVPLVGPTRDVSHFSYLSLRVAQNYNDAWNQAGVDQDFFVRLYTGAGYSSLVKISDHGRIPYADEFQWVPFPNPGGDFTKTAMNTVRIPLDAFDNVDLDDVIFVYMYFTAPGSSQAGSIHVDSLEFAH